MHNNMFLSFNQGDTQFTNTPIGAPPVSEDGPQLSSQTHLQHHVQILCTAKGFVQPGANMNVCYIHTSTPAFTDTHTNTHPLINSKT